MGGWRISECGSGPGESLAIGYRLSAISHWLDNRTANIEERIEWLQRQLSPDAPGFGALIHSNGGCHVSQGQAQVDADCSLAH